MNHSATLFDAGQPKDEVLTLGYNASTGGRVTTDDHAIYLQWEGSYNTGSAHYAEFHLIYDNGTQYRPWYWRINKAGVTDWIQWTTCTSFGYWDPAGTFSVTGEYFYGAVDGLGFNFKSTDTGLYDLAPWRIYSSSVPQVVFDSQISNNNLVFNDWVTVRIPANVTQGLQIGDGSISSPNVQFTAPGATSAAHGAYRNTGGNLLFGMNDSAGNTLGATSTYAATMSISGTRDFYLRQNSSNSLIITGTTQVASFGGPVAMLSSNDPGSGTAGYAMFTGTQNTGTARGAGVGTILFADGSSRNSIGFVKAYMGTTVGYIPIFGAN